MSETENIKHILGMETFNELLQTPNKIIIVDFWAEWCGPCRMLKPVLEKIAMEKPGEIILCGIDVDQEQNQGLAMKYEIASIPRVLVFKNGNIVDDFVGAMPYEMIKPMIDKHLSDDKGNDNNNVKMVA